MKLILTHEHADFDAVAAQLAAHKLDPSATPVLPRGVNHNVRDFLMLYQSALPHITVDDLPRGRVEAITMVDTQSVVTVKGMRPGTPVRVVDHHPPGDLPPHYTYFGEPLGATTTLLVEQIQEERLPLTGIEATLLALGIYEDTGSLLFGTTTARDIAAAAWLLTQGGDLGVVRQFLQHPLSDEQRRLYDLLLNNLTTYDIYGHPVIIAGARMPDTVEQISTVTHKLRDLLEPSALFVLVQMGDRLQVVARSTADEIDVGRIVARLGGGGHKRAAAALIEGGALGNVQTQLEKLLRELAEPAATVGDLMSWGSVQTVSADTPIEEALREMERSGHEGYPVLDDGELVGLLTRHAVDRAMRHKMGQRPVAEVMDSGRVVARPGQAIHHLQQAMIQSGWGQIPVVNEDGALLGIVTRTDLISHWGQAENGLSRREEIIARLQKALSPSLWALVRAVSEQAQAMDLGLYCAGGFVRDLLLAHPNTDVDLVVEGDAIALVRALVREQGGAMRKHDRFGTATWLLDAQIAAAFGASGDDWPEALDFVTARTEFYETPTALPTVTQGSIKLDLHRRDFSINTLAIRLSPEPPGQLLDFWGGERDLQRGLIRVLHSLSFVDDPTRILRAARFEQRFGFHIEARTLSLIEGALPLLDRVTGPRLLHEIELILREERPERVLGRLQALGVLAHLSPQLRADAWLRLAFAALRYALQHPPWPDAAAQVGTQERQMRAFFVLLTCRLDADEAERLGRRLQVRRTTLNAMLDGVRFFHEVVPALGEARRPSQVVRLLHKSNPIGLLVAWAIAPTYEARAGIARYASEWRHVRHTITQDELRALGVKSGPAYGTLLRRLRDAWLDGEVSTPEEERALAARLVAQLTAEGVEGDDDAAR